jgi:hypothetical protein
MKLYQLLFLLLFTTVGNAQYKISGTIKDENHKKIGNAIIQAIALETDEISAYTIAEENGSYTLNIANPAAYSIEISYLGYKMVANPIDVILSKKEYLLDVSLQKEEVSMLNEVVVLGKSSAMSEKGDTLSYNLKSFTNGSERNLKDILNKLPGIEIDGNGKIKANGKAVDKLLIDGQEFFGDNHQMATENLSAEMIGGVDFLNHYNDNSNIKDIEGSDKTALNIGIKEGYKGKVTGNLSLFSAHQSRYKGNANLFRFDKKLNLSLIANANDTNEEVISIMEYFNMNKSIKSEIKNNSVSDLSANNDIPIHLLSNDNVSQKRTAFGALNFSYFPTGKLKINGFSLVNHNFQNEQIINTNRFLQNLNSATVIDSIQAKGSFLFNQTKLNAEYVLNAKNILNYTLIVDPNNDSQSKNIDQLLTTVTNTIAENNTGNKLKIGHQLSYISRLAQNKLLTLNAYQEFLSNKSDYDLNSNQPRFDFGSTVFTQNRDYNQNEFGVLGKYVVKPKQTIYTFGFGYSAINQKFKSELNPANTWVENDVNVDRNFFSTGITLSKKKGFFQYSFENKLNLFVHAANRSERLFYLPKLELKLELKSTNNLRFNYQRLLQYPNANQLFENTVIQNYYTLNQSSKLFRNKPVLGDSFSLNYLFLDLFSGTIIFADVNYTQNKKSISTNSTYKQDYTIINNRYADADSKWAANISFERRLKWIKSRVKTNFSYSKREGFNFLNDQENKYHTEMYFAKIVLISKFKQAFFNYALGYEARWLETKYQLNATQTANRIYKPFLNFEGNVSKKITYHLSNSYSIFKTQGTERNFFKTDFDVSYRNEKSKWEYYMKANDVLNFNSTQIIETNLENNVEQTRILSRLPGYLGVGAKYNF